MQKLVFSPNSHNSLPEEWLPHRNCSDIWSFVGLAEDIDNPSATYSFRLEVQLISVGFKLFCDASYSFADLQLLTFHERRKIVPNADKRGWVNFDVDEDSLFLGEQIQILRDRGALALRLRDEELSLDMRLEKGSDAQWLGKDGALHLVAGPKQISTLMFGHSPFALCVGWVEWMGKRLRLQGRAALERMWGIYPFFNARTHWERFQLLMEDGGEYLLLNFPYAGQGQNYFIPPDGWARTVEGGTFAAMEYVELDDWRFGKGWKLDAPGVEGYPLFLIPLINEQFTLPVCRPVLSVVNPDGKRLGYGFAELLPGARNEIKKIPLSLYFSKA